MPLELHADSHRDHGLTAEALAFILARFADRSAFFLETFDLPETFPALSCALHGPIMGDAPISDSETTSFQRDGRAWLSRMVNRQARPTRTCTVIAGPHDGKPCVLYTAFGGPAAPQEVGDPACKDKEKSATFWAEHALSYPTADRQRWPEGDE